MGTGPAELALAPPRCPSVLCFKKRELLDRPGNVRGEAGDAISLISGTLRDGALSWERFQTLL